MRVLRAAITNLGCYETATLEGPEHPLLLVFGRNGSGKTTLLRALDFGLRGTVSGLPLETLRRVGSTENPAVRLEMDTGGQHPVVLERTLTARGVETRLNGRRSPTKDVTDLFLSTATITADAVLAGLLSGATFEAGLDQEALLTIIDQRVPPEAVADVPLAVLGLKPPATLSEIQDAYDETYARRRDINRALKVSVSSMPERVVTPDEVAAITAKLGDLRVDLERLLLDHGAAVERRRQLLARERDMLAHVQRETDPVVALELAEAQLVGAQADALKRLEVEGRMQAQRQHLADMVTRRDRLAKLADTCVIGDEIPCPLSKVQRTKMLATWGGQVDALRQAIAAEALGPAVDVAACERAVTVARQRVEAVTELVRVQTALQDIGSTTEAESRIEALRRRIAKGEASVEVARQSIVAQQAHERAVARRAEVRVELEAAEAIVKAFGSGGVRERLLGERLGALTARINGVLAHFGLAMEIDTQPWEVRLGGVPWRSLSRSESFRAGVALQVALAEASGIKFLVVDGIDILDRANRAGLFRVLEEALANGWIDQAIVTATYATEAPPTGNWPHAAVYVVEGGKIQLRRGTS